MPIAIGDVFGKLTVIGESFWQKGNRFFPCRCECGEEVSRAGGHLQTSVKKGKTPTCDRGACKRRWQLHGLGTSVEHGLWTKMRQACLNPNSERYPGHGGRGIKIVPRWMKFENFYADMGPRPEPGQNVCRHDEDADFSPENCYWGFLPRCPRWKRKNDRHRADTKFVEWRGRTQSVAEWSRETGLPYETIIYRIEAGWKLDDVFEKPRWRGGLKKKRRTPFEQDQKIWRLHKAGLSSREIAREFEDLSPEAVESRIARGPVRARDYVEAGKRAPDEEVFVQAPAQESTPRVPSPLTRYPKLKVKEKRRVGPGTVRPGFKVLELVRTRRRATTGIIKKTWLCQCRKCLRTFETTDMNRSSCGCLRRRAKRRRRWLARHHATEVHAWSSARLRASLKKIPFHPPWRSFALFLLEVGVAPSPNHVLVPIRRKKGFVPGNVEWIALSEAWRRGVRVPLLERTVVIDGVENTVREWLELYGVSERLYQGRLARGFDPVSAVTRPVQQFGKDGKCIYGHPMKTSSTGKSRWCVECNRKKWIRMRRRNPERHREQKRKYYRRRAHLAAILDKFNDVELGEIETLKEEAIGS